ncbi:MAG: YisL family protein [Staphylococcus epidermidis]|nr:YisL family protein [Staphylococcus epidermidis]
MLHVHILSWVLAIILFRLFMLLTLISGFWELIEEFMAASNGEGGNHMLLTLKMLCGLAVIAFMEISIAKRKKQQTSHKFFWITIILIIITMAIGVILPWGLKKRPK